MTEQPLPRSLTAFVIPVFWFNAFANWLSGRAVQDLDLFKGRHDTVPLELKKLNGTFTDIDPLFSLQFKLAHEIYIQIPESIQDTAFCGTGESRATLAHSAMEPIRPFTPLPKECAVLRPSPKVTTMKVDFFLPSSFLICVGLNIMYVAQNPFCRSTPAGRTSYKVPTAIKSSSPHNVSPDQDGNHSPFAHPRVDHPLFFKATDDSSHSVILSFPYSACKPTSIKSRRKIHREAQSAT
ncbi:hypothetical protein BDZ89DRAFT_1079559 [Hymenopellis radicata]|nr:hypothetical protein BDZ89DRAFT_1079559 [Hymenopellis radicata]